MISIDNVRQSLRFCILTMVAFLLAACAKEESPSFSIGTGGSAGRYVVVGRTLANVVNENRAINGFQLDSQLSSGSAANINGIIAGDIQFGIVQADHQNQAVIGTGEWSDKGPQEQLRAVFSIFTEAVTVIAGKDTNIRSLADLKGQLVDIGAPGSGTRQNAIDTLGAAGIDWQNDIQVREESLDDRLAKFMHGELDAFFYTVGHPNSEIKFATFSVRGARLVPLSNMDGLIADHPHYFITSIPTSLYPMADNNADIDTVGINATLLTSIEVPDEVVYALTKSAFESLESMTELDAEFGALLDDSFLEGLTAPLHPGALKYYREIGLDIPST